MVHDADRPEAGSRLQGRLHGAGVNRMVTLPAQAGDPQSARGRDRLHAVAEPAGADDQDLVVGAEAGSDTGLDGAAARGEDREHLRLGVHHPSEAVDHPLVELHPFWAVMSLHRPGHRLQHLGFDADRTRNQQQVAFFHVRRLSHRLRWAGQAAQDGLMGTPRLAVVTGGSRGIGRAFVLEAARRGFEVVFNYRDRARAAAGVAHSSGVRSPSRQADSAPSRST